MSQPKTSTPRAKAQERREQLRAALDQRAHDELGEGEDGLAWIELRVAGGATMREITDGLALDPPIRPDWLTDAVTKIWPEAKGRLRAARERAGVALLEEARRIADEPADTSADVQRNRLRAETRMNLARAFDPTFRDTKQAPTQVNLNLGALFLAAHRAINAGEVVVPRPSLPAASSGQTAPALPAGETETDFQVVNDP